MTEGVEGVAPGVRHGPPPLGGGKTYAELRDVQTGLRARWPRPRRTATPSWPTCRSETVFKGETLRGLLLTSYGFSALGEKADELATVAHAAAGLMLLSRSPADDEPKVLVTV